MNLSLENVLTITTIWQSGIIQNAKTGILQNFTKLQNSAIA